MTEWTIYVDLDAYYVGCEVRDRPELEGQPVIVGPDPRNGARRGVVLSASYPARALGVRTAMPVGRAAELAPDAVWIDPDHAKYERISREVRGVLDRYSDRVVPLSIDEAAVVLESEALEPVVELGRTIQSAIQNELRLSASLGIASHRTVAKIASDRQKPRGLTVVAPGEIRAFLAPLPARAIPGVGPKTAALLEARGWRTIGDLDRAGLAELRKVLGEGARWIRSLARGTPIPLAPDVGGPQLRSADRTFGEDVGDVERLKEVLDGMAESLYGSLATDRLAASTVGVAARWEDFTRTQRSRRLAHAVASVEELRVASGRLLRALWAEERAGRGRKVRTLSLRLERLAPRRGRLAPLDRFPAPEADPLN